MSLEHQRAIISFACLQLCWRVAAGGCCRFHGCANSSRRGGGRRRRRRRRPPPPTGQPVHSSWATFILVGTDAAAAAGGRLRGATGDTQIELIKVGAAIAL